MKNPEKFFKKLPEKPGEGVQLNEKYFEMILNSIGEDLKDMTPQRLRAEFITKLFNIPQGWSVGLGVEEIEDKSLAKDNFRGTDVSFERKQVRFTTPNLDRLLRKYFVDTFSTLGEHYYTGEFAIFQDFTLHEGAREKIDQFRKEIEKIEDEREREFALRLWKIFDGEMKLTEHIQREPKRKKVENVRDILSFLLVGDLVVPNQEVHFHYLSGGIPLFLRGYIHHPEWQELFGKDLVEIYKDSDYISIEGYSNQPLGESSFARWKKTFGSYEILMRDFVRKGFSGRFLETDHRFYHWFQSLSPSFLSKLSDDFYRDYYRYIIKENESLKKWIPNFNAFKSFLIKSVEYYNRRSEIEFKHKEIFSLKALDLPEQEISHQGSAFFFEDFVTGDALSALKFLSLSNLMVKGEIEKGIVVDFQGGGHTVRKSFFLRYPQYAAEVVLRGLHLLMSEHLSRKNEKLAQRDAQEMYRNPDWVNIIREIGRIPVFRVSQKDIRPVSSWFLFQRPMKKEGEYNIFDTLNVEIDDLPGLIEKVFDDEYLQKIIDSYQKT